MTAPRFQGPDWFSGRIPIWQQVLAPLLRMAAERPLHCLEIGSYEGRSALWTVENLVAKHGGSTLTCIDPWDDPAVGENFDFNTIGRYDERPPWAGRVFRAFGRSRYHLPDLFGRNGSYFDFIYIDGAHDAPTVLFDSALSFELLKPGGILIWDDYAWSAVLDGGPRAPKMAIDAFITCNQERLRLLYKGVQVAAERLR